MIGERTAEDLKIKIGSAFSKGGSTSMDIRGRDLVTGLPKNLTVTSDEMREALQDTVNSIAELTHSVLEKTPPELSADIADKGIIMTGGGALLTGLSDLIENVNKVPVHIAENPISCVAEGTGKMLEYLDKMGISESGDGLNLV